MACHQIVEESFSWNVDNTINVASIIFSGVLVYFLGVWRENKQEKDRKRNLIKGLQSETEVNLDFAKHNAGMIDAHRKKKTLAGLKSLNLLSFKNACADEVLGYANISLSDEQRESIRHYVVVVEHVNSIIKDYLENKDENGNLRESMAKHVEDFCSNHEDSVPNTIKKIDFQSLFDRACKNSSSRGETDGPK